MAKGSSFCKSSRNQSPEEFSHSLRGRHIFSPVDELNRSLEGASQCASLRGCALAGLVETHICKWRVPFMKTNDSNLAAPQALQQLCNDVLLEKYAAPGETSVEEIQKRVAAACALRNRSIWTGSSVHKPQVLYPVVVLIPPPAWHV